MRAEKCYKHKPTHPGTPLDTADAMVNSPGHVGVGFAEKRHGLCETDVRRFQTSKKGPNASSNLVKTPVRPPFSIGTHERTTKLNGVEVRVATKRPQGLGGRALGLAHDRELSGVSARKRG